MIERMFDRLAVALQLVQEEFEDSRARDAWLSDAELAGRVEAAQRVMNAAAAVQMQRIAEYAAREDVAREDGTWGQQDRGLGHLDEFASGVIGPGLGLSPAAADSKVGVAARMASVMGPTLRVMAAGDLDVWRATVLTRELADADPTTAAAVQEAVLQDAPTQTAGQIRARARRVLARIDPNALRERVARARDERGVWRRPGEPGVSEWQAVLPNETSALCWAAVDELARRYRADGDARTLDQARADAMADLMLGHATVSTTVTFAVPAVEGGAAATPGGCSCGTVPAVWTPWGLPVDVEPEQVGGGDGVEGLPIGSEGPVGVDVAGNLLPPEALPVVEVPGVGEVPGEVVRSIASAFGTRAVLALCDWRTGTLATETCLAYRPPPWLDQLVKARDGTCRFPGCTVTAVRCDVDHVIAAPRGPTDKTNLMCLCRHHHRMKQQPRWAVEMTEDGVATWTTPIGDRFTTWPVDHLGRSGRDARARTESVNTPARIAG